MKQKFFQFPIQNLILAAVIATSFLLLTLLALSPLMKLSLPAGSSPGSASPLLALSSLEFVDSADDSLIKPAKDDSIVDDKGDIGDLDDESDNGAEDAEEELPELYDFPYPIIIRAIHPGYTEGGVSDVGELIELQNLSDAPLSLAGFSLRYTNGTGTKTVTIFDFPEGSLMTGETLLLRHYNKKLDEQAPADLYYTSSLAFSAGPLELVAGDIVVDSVCWKGGDKCEDPFNSKKPTVLVRNLFSGQFEHKTVHEIAFDPDNPSYYAPAEPEEDTEEAENLAPPQCFALEFSEVYSYYATDQSEQFIELYNPSSATVLLDGCQLRYKKKLYDLAGSIAPDGYFAFYPGEQFSLTKNPSSAVSIELIDADGGVVEEISYPKGQKKSTSYARIYDSSGVESWLQTYAITPGAENVYQEYRTCESGKAINPLTGNCVKISSLSTTPKICEEGKYLNPLTGRCKSISTAESTLKPCAEGYERNPETNRCRKVTSANDGAEYALVPNTRSDNKVFIAFGIVALLVSAGAVYIVLQFRREIARMIRKICQRLNRIFQDLLAGKISLHRDKKP